MADILLLEDMKPLRRILSHALREEGHEVVEGADGALTYDSALLGKIDVLITDIDMPRVNGFEVILEAQKRRPDLKIIAISGGTGQSVNEYLTACVELGVHQVMQKPFEPDALVETVRSVLSDQVA